MSSGLGADTSRHTKHITASLHSFPSAVSSGSPLAQENATGYVSLSLLCRRWNLDAINDAPFSWQGRQSCSTGFLCLIHCLFLFFISAPGSQNWRRSHNRENSFQCKFISPNSDWTLTLLNCTRTQPTLQSFPRTISNLFYFLQTLFLCSSPLAVSRWL